MLAFFSACIFSTFTSLVAIYINNDLFCHSLATYICHFDISCILHNYLLVVVNVSSRSRYVANNTMSNEHFYHAYSVIDHALKVKCMSHVHAQATFMTFVAPQSSKLSHT